jgi:hypothetical protein
MWRSLKTRERRVFSESFHPFRAKPHKVYIYRQYTCHNKATVYFNPFIMTKNIPIAGYIYIYICTIASNDNNQCMQFVCPYCRPIDWNNKYSYSYSYSYSVNVDINNRLPIKIYYRICTLKTYQNRNNSWKTECVLSFNVGWRIIVFYLLISANPC